MWYTIYRNLIVEVFEVAAKDNFFKARMTDEQINTLDSIVKEIQENTPEASVTSSSIARYALEKYISDYRAKKSREKIFIEINTRGATKDDMASLNELFKEMLNKAEQSGNIVLTDMVGQIYFVIMDDFVQKYLMPKKTGEARKSGEMDLLSKMRPENKAIVVQR
jgi:hypothetical protein